MNELYPLKFKPIFKEKIWGGQRIKTFMDLDFSPLPNCGEAWVLSGVPGENSIVSNGFLAGNELNELLEVYMDELAGTRVYEQCGNEFPLLIKLIDANEYLSVQVHPDDELARKRGLPNGKTEMWYVLHAEEGAEMINGFKGETNKQKYLDVLEQKKLKDILHFETLKNEDVVFIPAGRVHAMGPGILVAEIQQTSDVTYRIYDWDRMDAMGKSREIHTALALDAIDFTPPVQIKNPFRKALNETVNLVDSEHFITNILHFDQAVAKDYSEQDSFVIYLAVEGSIRLHYKNSAEILHKGEAILVPACLDRLVLYPLEPSKVVEVYV